MGAAGWFRSAVVYQIFLDRFAGYDREKDWRRPQFLGGNLRGILRKLDYLQELGVSCLWLSPFYECSAYHGYSITDYLKPDPRFGTMGEVEELVSAVHKRGMRIIADFVPNHCSSRHPFFVEAQQEKNSEYSKWFIFTKWPHRYLSFLSVKSLPKINLEYGPAREHMIDAAKFWLSKGFDGFRLDHVLGPSHDFWRAFRKAVKSQYPEAVLIGEAWMTNISFGHLRTLGIRRKYRKWLFNGISDMALKEYIGEMDGCLDFTFQHLVEKHIAHKRFYRPRALLDWRLKRHYARFPKGYLLPSFLDNHDMDRFLFECGDRKDRLKEAARLQFSQDQPAVIYYGTEAGMSQEKRIAGEHGDVLARQPMPWDDIDPELFDFYRELIASHRKRVKEAYA